MGQLVRGDVMILQNTDIEKQLLLLSFVKSVRVPVSRFPFTTLSLPFLLHSLSPPLTCPLHRIFYSYLRGRQRTGDFFGATVVGPPFSRHAAPCDGT
ncbi:hypothetical protein EVAR_7166_1 [Eumeta japonica]|uniref:Uncharacterized protein n=1 Tax=Eumeta variegata TaxID=151549 RepID=A0A4C1U6K3_EUMVA|nr:hypothetical protein EVAR_7166_1 [Eumeta japonica]